MVYQRADQRLLRKTEIKMLAPPTRMSGAGQISLAARLYNGGLPNRRELFTGRRLALGPALSLFRRAAMKSRRKCRALENLLPIDRALAVIIGNVPLRSIFPIFCSVYLNSIGLNSTGCRSHSLIRFVAFKQDVFNAPPVAR